MRRSASRIVISHAAGFLVFIIILGIANMIDFKSPVLGNIVMFFNANIILLLVMMVFGLLNDIFWQYSFPFNVLAPVSGAVLGVLIVTFICRMFSLTDSYLRIGSLPCVAIATIVFFLVLIGGFATILVRGGKPREEWHEEKKRKRHGWPEWEDVGKEFRMAMYNLGKSLEKAFGPRKK